MKRIFLQALLPEEYGEESCESLCRQLQLTRQMPKASLRDNDAADVMDIKSLAQYSCSLEMRIIGSQKYCVVCRDFLRHSLQGKFYELMDLSDYYEGKPIISTS